MTTEKENLQPLSSDEHVDSRDFRVKSIALIASDGTSTEISKLVAEVQLRQDLYLGFMNGEMLVTDGNDLHSRTALHGGEYVFLHIIVPEQKIEVRKAFRVYKVSNREGILNNSQRYVIHFTSDELFSSSINRISKAYENLPASEIARDILVNHMKIPPERVFIDETSTPLSVIIPNWRYAEALHWLASRAYSDKSNCWFFYEDLEGFHFASLNAIYRRGTRVKVPFTLDNKRGLKQLDMDKFALDDYTAKRDFDILSTASSGGYSMGLLTVNPLTRTYDNLQYGLNGQKLQYDYPYMSNGDNLFAKTALNLAYLAYDGIENWITRTMRLAALNNSLINLVAPGNMGLEIGTMVNLRIPYVVTPAEGDMWDKRKSGKYLIIGVNHKFDMPSHQHTTLFSVTRDSIPEALPVTDTTLSTKIRKLSR